jgi:hypothetical protein
MQVLLIKGRSKGGQSCTTRFVSCLLLVALFLQVTPFVIPLSASSVDAPADVVSQYFEPLQVCSDLRGTGILLNDIPWIPPSPLEISSLAEAIPFFAAVCQTCRKGFSPSPFRPPRPLVSLS